MKIVAFGASNSKQSINKQFATFTANLFDAEDVEIIDLNDFELPLYGIDREKKTGIPETAVAFYDKLQSADLIIISLAEHNGSYTTVFKNLLDWMSRHNTKVFSSKKVFLLSTSPGGMGGKFVMEAAMTRFPRHGAEVIGQFSLPSFNDNFDGETGVKDEDLKQRFQKIIDEVKRKL